MNNIAALNRAWVSAFLDDVGNGSGQTNAIGNYPSPTEFRLVAPVGTTIEIASATLEIVSSAMNRYGYMNGLLTNGTDFFVSEKVSGVYTKTLQFFSSAQGFKAIIHQDYYASGATSQEDIARIFSNPVAAPMMYFHWDFVALFGAPIVLRGASEGKIVFQVNDNFAAIGAIRHRLMVRGFRYAERYANP